MRASDAMYAAAVVFIGLGLVFLIAGRWGAVPGGRGGRGSAAWAWRRRESASIAAGVLLGAAGYVLGHYFSM